MAVQESAQSQDEGRNGGGEAKTRASETHTVRFTLPALVLSVWMALGLPTKSLAQVVADPNAGANGPTVGQTANGLPQVNITRPSAAGVSTNAYTQFDVPKAGVILNNSPTITATQQAGYINGNPNLLPGGSARIIVNQITSTLPSQMQGYLEVAGPRSEVIVANPNGILVDGAGFINTSRATLTTGVPVYGGSGSLDAFRVTSGQITVQGEGLNAANVDQVDLIARAVQANAALYANQLNVIVGANQVNHDTLVATPIAGAGAAPAMGIDVAQLGGMYANKILLASTENGVGVSLRGVAAAQAGDLTLTAQGKLILAGQTNASGNLVAYARDGIDNTGTTYGTQGVSVNTDGVLSNSGTLAAQQWLNATGGSVSSTGTLAAGVNADGTTAAPADLTVIATSGAMAATGRNQASGNATLQGTGVSLAGSQTTAGGNLNLQAGAGDLDLTSATVAAGAGLVAATQRALINDRGQMSSQGATSLAAGNVSNRGGQIVSQGATTIASTGAIDNIQGTVQAGGALTANAASLDNTAGRIVSLDGAGLSIQASGVLKNVAGTTANGAQGGVIGGNGNVRLAAGAITNHGQVSALGNTTLNATSLDNAAGNMVAGGALAVAVTGTVNNRQGNLYGQSGLSVRSGSLDNTGGSVQTQGDLSVSADGGVANTDGTLAANGDHGKLAVGAASVDNTRGVIGNSGDGTTTVTANTTLTNTAGRLGGNGDVTIHAQTLANSTDGTTGALLASGGALNLDVSTAVDNRGGTLYGGKGLTLDQAGAALHNTAGQILGGTNVRVNVASVNNLGGAVKANHDVAVAGAVSGSGEMAAGRNLSLDVAGDYANDAANKLRADGDMRVAATGTLNNTGMLAAVGGLTVQGADIVNAAGAGMNGSTTTVSASHSLSNAGRIEGDTVQTSSPTTANTGTIIGNNVTVQGAGVVNTGDAALMAAAQNLHVYASNSVQNLDGATLYGAGNLRIARDGTRDPNTGLLVNQTNALTNRSATIEAEGEIDIAATQVSNTRTSIVTAPGTPTSTSQTLTLWQAGLTGGDLNNHTSITFPGWTWNTSNAQVSTPQTNALRAPITVTVDKSTVTGLDTGKQTLSFTQSPIEQYVGYYAGPNCDVDTGVCSRPIATSPIQYYQSITDNGGTYSITFWPDWDPNKHIRPDEVRQANFGHDYNEISRTTVITTATDELISASDPAKIQAGGSIRINSSGGNILNQSSIMAAGGDLTRVATAGGVQDIGTALQQKVSTAETSTFYWHQRTGGSQDWQDVAYPSTPQAPTTVMALPAIASANQTVQTTAQTIDVTTVNRSGETIIGSGVGGGATQGKPQQTLSTAQGGIPNLRLPTNGLYRHQSAPGATYLIATDPRFTQYSKFISSDYMLGQLGLDPMKTQKRLGDGFYEEKLIRDQVTQLTGRTFLAGYSDNLTEYQALMDNGVAYARAFNLAPGIGLTADQMAQLTTDMVWLVSQDVTLPDGTQQSVLVPKLYLAQSHTFDLQSSGALVTGSQVSLNAAGDVTNSGKLVGDLATQVLGNNIVNRGQIGSTGTTMVQAQQDVQNLGGRIAGTDTLVTAGRDVINVAQTITNTTTLSNGNSASATGVGTVGTISATNNVGVLAGRDINMAGGSVNAGKDALLGAGRDLNLGTAATTTTQDATAHGGRDHLHDKATAGAGSLVQAGGSVTAVAGRDATLSGSAIQAGEDATLLAGRNTTVTASMDTHTRDAGAFSNKQSQFTQSSYDETARGSSVQAGNNATLGAGQSVAGNILRANGIAPVPTDVGGKGDLAILGSVVTTGGANGGGGAAKLAATGDVTVGTVTGQHTSESWSQSRHSGFLSKEQTTTQTSQQQTVAVGSLVSADSVAASAGRDLTVMGSSIAGSGNVALHADRNLTIGAAQSTASSTTSEETRKSGMFSGGGATVTFGKQQVNQTKTEQSTTHTGSMVGSVGGNVSLSAGEGYAQTGSAVTALQGDVDIRAKTVDIKAATDTWRSDQETHFKQSGLTIAVSNPVLAAAQTATQMAQAQSQTSDPRMKALAGAATGLAGKNAFDAVSKDPQAAGGISVSITVGGSKSHSTQTQTSTTALGSKVNAGGYVSIQATGAGQASNINIIGSDVKAGNDLLLKADNQVNLQAAANTAEQHSNSKSMSGGVGLAVSYGSNGAAFGVTANAAAARGNADGNDVAWTNTHATAGNTLTIESGGDTNLKGTVVSGKQVVANVGGDLNMESLQDTSTYHSKDQSASGSVTVGYGFSGSASVSQQKMDSDFASVGEQTAIRAGSGGYQVDVKGNTDLKGAVIAGGTSDKNSLSTDTLTVSDIQNHAHYSASSIGIGGGYSSGGSSGKSGVGVNQSGEAATAGSGAVPGTDLPTTGGAGQGASFAPPMVAAASGSASSTTQSGISGGNITIRNDAKQQELTGKSADDTVASVNRDTTNTANSLNPIFNASEIKADFQIVGALQRESGIFLNNRATEAESAKKAAEAAAKDPNATPDQRAALQQQADDLAKWGQGGSYRQVMTALTAAASGNVTGSTAQFAQNAAVGYLQGLAANEVKGLADSLGKGTPEAEAARWALHAIVGCAGAAAASQSCGAGAMGAATASVLGSLLSPTDGMTAEQKQARENAIQSLVAGVAGATGGNAAAAMNGATFEIENNQLSPVQSGGALPAWGPATPQKPFQAPGKPADPSEAALTGTPDESKDNTSKPIVQPIVDTADTIGAVVGGILPNPLKTVEGLGAIFSSGNGAPKYVPSPKHDVGGWGTPMDLEDSAAQQVLNDSVQGGKQRYGVSDGKVYEFQPDNAGGWHGYPVPGNEVPTSVLRTLLQRGDINRVEYGKLIKGK
ncbi:hemagglutinin repeat-containing protein [Cupriavidus sp. H18C2]|uniref:hemagglutinin repeat-containing protein n=2 Tax=Pseudomonadota TaxID=1224 RepID=UPI003BF8EB88